MHECPEHCYPLSGGSFIFCFKYLHFRYHRHGLDLGELNIIRVSGDRRQTLWSMSGIHGGDVWYEATVPIPQADWNSDYQVRHNNLVAVIRNYVKAVMLTDSSNQVAK